MYRYVGKSETHSHLRPIPTCSMSTATVSAFSEGWTWRWTVTVSAFGDETADGSTNEQQRRAQEEM